MAYRLSLEAEAELDEIWLYVARASGSMDIASRLIDTITARFWLLSTHPRIGRPRDRDLRPGLRSLTAGGYIILYRLEDGDAVILHVVMASRDLDLLLGS